MSQAKSNILSRLKQSKPIPTARKQSTDFPELADNKPFESPAAEYQQERQKLIAALTENHIEVHPVTADGWPQKLCELAEEKGAKNWLLGNKLDYQQTASKALSDNDAHINITHYTTPYSTLRKTLFHDIDASLTLAQAAIADTGTLLLIPNQHEPRMMSLIPPIHFVKLSAKDIYSDMASLLTHLNPKHQDNLPSNILLISSPSKTADIQQTLAYGAHGPKEVIVLLED